MLHYLHEQGVKKSLAKCLRTLARLQHAFFVNYLQKDYIKRQSVYQRALNKASQCFYTAMVQAEKRVQRKTQYAAIFESINHISEIVFSLNQLRFRNSDYSTFKICAIELQAIEKYTLLAFRQLAYSISENKKIKVDLPDFEEAIHGFESIYNRTLQIVSIDPLVFMFFIQDLYALNDAIQCLLSRINNQRQR